VGTPTPVLTDLAGTDDLPLLVLGPSLGTSVHALWQPVADLLGDRWHVVGWDLPGHGASRTALGTTTMAELAAGVLAAVETPVFAYAGDSAGGAVGLQLLLDAPERVSAAAVLCTGARIGEPAGWHDRAAVVRAQGTGSQLDGSRQRWFAPGFVERRPVVAQALLDSLAAADADGYAAVCDALASFDVRDRLGEITAPVLAVAGAEDGPTPPTSLETIADGVRHGTLAVLPGVGHLAPAEAPAEVADLIAAHLVR